MRALHSFASAALIAWIGVDVLAAGDLLRAALESRRWQLGVRIAGLTRKAQQAHSG